MWKEKVGEYLFLTNNFEKKPILNKGTNMESMKKTPGPQKVFAIHGVPIGPEERVRNLRAHDRLDSRGCSYLYCMAVSASEEGFNAEGCFAQDFVNHHERFLVVSYRKDLGDITFNSGSDSGSETNVEIVEVQRVPWMDRSQASAEQELEDILDSPYAEESAAFQEELYDIFRKDAPTQDDS